MIGLDTNVLVRYLVQDDLEQSERANQLIEKHISEGETISINQITLCEIFWVLEKCYKLKKDELISILKSLLQTRQIKIEGEHAAWQALQDYEKKTKVGFPDCLIGRQNIHLGCRHTFTFDNDAIKQLPDLFKKVY